jgi:XTP/dITP diphosphohydrolase
VDLVSLNDVDVVGEAVEDGETFAANAELKARFATAATGLASLADDSGLEVEALGGGPGVRTRRYAGPDATDDDNNQKLLAALEGLPAERRAARYVCVLALARPGAVGIALARGVCRGRIAPAPRGRAGFGYDPIFEPEAEPPGGRTFGLYSTTEKNAISHRAAAARTMAAILRDLGF